MAHDTCGLLHIMHTCQFFGHRTSFSKEPCQSLAMLLKAMAFKNEIPTLDLFSNLPGAKCDMLSGPTNEPGCLKG